MAWDCFKAVFCSLSSLICANSSSVVGVAMFVTLVRGVLVVVIVSPFTKLKQSMPKVLAHKYNPSYWVGYSHVVKPLSNNTTLVMLLVVTLLLYLVNACAID